MKRERKAMPVNSPIKFKQNPDGSWASYRNEQARPDSHVKEPYTENMVEKGKRLWTTFTLAALKRLNTASLEALAKRHGVDISAAANNKQRAELIHKHFENKKSENGR